MPFATEPREGPHATWPMCRVVVATRRLAPEREAAVANLLRIYRNHLALLDYGEHDTLTALRNRRTFEADFARLLREGVPRAVEPGRPAETRRSPLPQVPQHDLSADAAGRDD